MTVGNLFTPAVDDVIIVACTANTSTSFTSVTSGWTGTFIELVTPFGGNASFTHVWAMRVGGSPGSSQPTINFAGTDRGSANSIQISGVDNTGNVEDKFLQTTNLGTQYNGGSPLVLNTLSSYASVDNLSLTVNGADANILFDPQSGWTQAEESDDATNQHNTAVMYFAGEDLTHTAEATTNFNYKRINAVGFEIEEAGAPAPSGGSLLLINRSIANFHGVR